MTLKLQYYRGDGGFSRKFNILQDGSAFDITALTTPTVRWWFKDEDGNQKSIDWTGATVDSQNNRVQFDVPGNFFDLVTVHECQIEIWDAGALVWHSDPIFLVEVDEPSGLHTD